MQQRLRLYQAMVGRAVLDSVLHRKGLTFTVEIARQGGKNELSAQLELLLLTLHISSGGNLVKAAPTFVPQALISMQRLRDRLNDAGFGGVWATEAGHILRLYNARQVFLSAERSANVLGATAHHLLELDEAQDIDPEKFYKEFRPMGAASNTTTVLYGTPWDQDSLLEQAKQQNLGLEKKDGVKRHFQFNWEEVALCNPLYHRYVEAERERLGEEHPLFRTQYRLLPLAGGSGLFSLAQQAQLQGDHPRLRRPTSGKLYVAGIDVGGEGQAANASEHDATVVIIGELDFSLCDELRHDPAVRVVEHYVWRGQPHHALLSQLVDLLRNVWHCRRVVVDATGVGAGVASMLGKALGSALEPFVFTAPSKSRLGFELLAAVNSGRLKLYAPDGSPEHQECWAQIERAEGRFRPNRTMDFLVNPSRGHDDFLMSLALLVKAAEYMPRAARGHPRE
ncbi:MAG: hypothetical protein HYY31_03645 [Chloroflexi bacterium]|nr:hypothetical protein [Chloroflexota bacterium]